MKEETERVGGKEYTESGDRERKGKHDEIMERELERCPEQQQQTEWTQETWEVKVGSLQNAHEISDARHALDTHGGILLEMLIMWRANM